LHLTLSSNGCLRGAPYPFYLAPTYLVGLAREKERKKEAEKAVTKYEGEAARTRALLEIVTKPDTGWGGVSEPDVDEESRFRRWDEVSALWSAVVKRLDADALEGGGDDDVSGRCRTRR